MIEVIRPGTQLSLVDLGREGYRRYGVPLGGAMDQRSAMLANSIVGNRMDSAVIEMYQPGHILKFHESADICLTGAIGNYEIDDQKLTMDQVIRVERGSSLKIGVMDVGSRVYLGLRGSIICGQKLGSISALPGYDRAYLKKGSQLLFESPSDHVDPTATLRREPIVLREQIDCYKGPEFQFLSEHMVDHILSSRYVISPQSNRMGYRLNGPQSGDYRHTPILSSGVMPGTVQFLPIGLPLILMRDGATTGGYPRILQIVSQDINRLAQMSPGYSIRFSLKDPMVS